jgi:hypothetical protein
MEPDELAFLEEMLESAELLDLPGGYSARVRGGSIGRGWRNRSSNALRQLHEHPAAPAHRLKDIGAPQWQLPAATSVQLLATELV